MATRGVETAKGINSKIEETDQNLRTIRGIMDNDISSIKAQLTHFENFENTERVLAQLNSFRSSVNAQCDLFNEMLENNLKGVEVIQEGSPRFATLVSMTGVKNPSLNSESVKGDKVADPENKDCSLTPGKEGEVSTRVERPSSSISNKPRPKLHTSSFVAGNALSRNIYQQTQLGRETDVVANLKKFGSQKTLKGSFLMPTVGKVDSIVRQARDAKPHASYIGLESLILDDNLNSVAESITNNRLHDSTPPTFNPRLSMLRSFQTPKTLSKDVSQDSLSNQVFMQYKNFNKIQSGSSFPNIDNIYERNFVNVILLEWRRGPRPARGALLHK